MRRKVAGVPIYSRRVAPGVQRPRNWTPERAAQYGWEFNGWILWVRWSHWTGFQLTGAWLEGSGWPGTRIDVSEHKGRRMRKPPVPSEPQKPETLLPYETKVLKAFPRFTAFLTDQWYDDGTPRERGTVWFDSVGSFFTALLKEHTLGLCARIRAGTIDDLYKAIEVFLGLETPPWEVDKYAREKAGKKSKK